MSTLWIYPREFQAWSNAIAVAGVELTDPKWTYYEHLCQWHASMDAIADWQRYPGSLNLKQWSGSNDAGPDEQIVMGAVPGFYPQLLWPIQTTAIEALMLHSLLASFGRTAMRGHTYVQTSIDGLRSLLRERNQPIPSIPAYIKDWVRHLWLNPIVFRKYRSSITVQTVPALDEARSELCVIAVVRRRTSRLGGSAATATEQMSILRSLTAHGGEIRAMA
jgi:hypothetical protein